MSSISCVPVNTSSEVLAIHCTADTVSNVCQLWFPSQLNCLSRSYLSAEQRSYPITRIQGTHTDSCLLGLNYLVKIGEDGRLYWEKNNQLVDTTAGDWKDAGRGQGIVPESMPTHHLDLRKSVLSNTISNNSKDQENAATHYTGQPKGRNSLYKYLRGYFTTRGMVDRLLRKTVKRNTWIYISVCSLSVSFEFYLRPSCDFIQDKHCMCYSSFLAPNFVSWSLIVSYKLTFLLA